MQTLNFTWNKIKQEINLPFNLYLRLTNESVE